MTNPSPKKLLQKHSLAPHKRFGQNFLVNPQTARSIVNCGTITAEDTVIEVGVGLGALTQPLAEKARRVIGVEIDHGIIRYHEDESDLPENVTLIQGDILRVDFAELRRQSGMPLKIMANLPYSISNPFIFTLISNWKEIDWVVVMLQKEVAERLVAQPSTKQYGIPTVLLSAYAEVEKLLIVRPHEFHPRPKVDSMVIRLDFGNFRAGYHGFDEMDHALFSAVVRAAFAQRRKTLLNNIANLRIQEVPANRQTWKKMSEKIIIGADLSPTIRAEDLTPQDFISLTLSAQRVLGADGCQ